MVTLPRVWAIHCSIEYWSEHRLHWSHLVMVRTMIKTLTGPSATGPSAGQSGRAAAAELTTIMGDDSSNGRSGQRGWPLVVTAGLALAVAACTSPKSGEFPEPPQPKASITEIPASLITKLPGAGGEFIEPERHRLASFLDAFRDGGRGPLLVKITAADSRTAAAAAAALRTLATRRGVVEDAVTISTTTAGRPGITLRYTDFVAVAPQCNPEVVLSRDPTQAVSPNLGCATERTFSAMVAHPADLVAPAAEADADAGRQDRVLDAYRHGKSTQAEVNRNDDMKASKVGGN
jgi:pilus biogenesis lipoprotein CpaD